MSEQEETTGRTIDANAEPLVAMRRTLSSLPGEVIEYDAKADPKYLSGSQADQDARSTDEMAVETLIGQAKMALMSAADHMAAVERALDGPLLTFSPWTVARTVLEATALVYWLLEPTGPTRDRISRSLVLRVLDVDGQIRFEKSQRKGASASSNALANLASRRDEIVRRATGLQIPVAYKNDRVTKIGSISLSLPSVSLMREFLDAEQEYRMLSGAEHQRFTPLRELAMRDLPGTDGRVSIPSIDSNKYRYLIISPIKWYGAAAPAISCIAVLTLLGSMTESTRRNELSFEQLNF